MSKLPLNLDELSVDSFEIARDAESGTVRDFAWSDDSVCPTTGPSDRRPCY